MVSWLCYFLNNFFGRTNSLGPCNQSLWLCTSNIDIYLSITSHIQFNTVTIMNVDQEHKSYIEVPLKTQPTLVYRSLNALKEIYQDFFFYIYLSVNSFRMLKYIGWDFKMTRPWCPRTLLHGTQQQYFTKSHSQQRKARFYLYITHVYSQTQNWISSSFFYKYISK